MFAPKHHHQVESPAVRKLGRANSALDRKTAPAYHSPWQSLALSTRGMQPKLIVGQADDLHEREADHIADQVMKMPTPSPSIHQYPFTSVTAPKAQRKCAQCEEKEEKLQRKEQGGKAEVSATAPPIVHEAVQAPGQPLDPATRAFVEPRFGHDFSQVKVHTETSASDSAQAINALAYTVGSRIVFAAGAYQPQTASGQRLLAHELAHVVQQSGAEKAAPDRSPEKGGVPASRSGDGSLNLSPVSSVVQRQPNPATSPAPTFSVNQTTYTALINQALGQMSGRLVESETLVTTAVPILQAMLTNPVWKDAQGATHGGGTVQHTLSSSTTLNLQLILNDAANPRLAGEFTGRGASNGEMEIFIRSNPTTDELAETLYHESMHLVSWLINRPTPALSLRSGGRSGSAGAAGTLDLAHSGTQISNVRLWLDTLAQSVNGRRTTGPQISAADLDRMARWLVEEVNVRIETEVFRLASSTQQALATPGPAVIIGTGTNWQINASMVDRYVFDLSGVFLPTDRAGLTPADRQALTTLMQILEGIFQNRVRRRFNPSPYLAGRGIPRAQVQWMPPPLTPPKSFGPLPTP